MIAANLIGPVGETNGVRLARRAQQQRCRLHGAGSSGDGFRLDPLLDPVLHKDCASHPLPRRIGLKPQDVCAGQEADIGMLQGFRQRPDLRVDLALSVLGNASHPVRAVLNHSSISTASGRLDGWTPA